MFCNEYMNNYRCVSKSGSIQYKTKVFFKVSNSILDVNRILDVIKTFLVLVLQKVSIPTSAQKINSVLLFY